MAINSNEQSARQVKWLLAARELIWILFAAVFAAGVLYPIVSKVQYFYTLPNFLFVFVAMLYARYIIVFNRLPFVKPTWFRFSMFVLNIELIIYFMNREEKLIGLVDNFTIEDFGIPFKTLSAAEIGKFYEYMYLQVSVFATAAVIMLVIMQLRLILSYWKMAQYRMEENEKA